MPESIVVMAMMVGMIFILTCFGWKLRVECGDETSELMYGYLDF